MLEQTAESHSFPGWTVLPHTLLWHGACPVLVSGCECCCCAQWGKSLSCCSQLCQVIHGSVTAKPCTGGTARQLCTSPPTVLINDHCHLLFLFYNSHPSGCEMTWRHTFVSPPLQRGWTFFLFIGILYLLWRHAYSNSLLCFFVLQFFKINF